MACFPNRCRQTPRLGLKTPPIVLQSSDAAGPLDVGEAAANLSMHPLNYVFRHLGPQQLRFQHRQELFLKAVLPNSKSVRAYPTISMTGAGILDISPFPTSAADHYTRST